MLLSFVLFLPILGALSLLFVDRSDDKLIKWIAQAVTLLVFVLSLPLYWAYDAAEAATGRVFQLSQFAPWIPSLGVNYSVALDGISLVLVLLVTFLMPIVVLASVKTIQFRHREFYALLLLLESFMIGAFAARDLFLFYLCWELMVVPMYFIIGIWGGKPKIYAATKFFLFTLAGSLPMLIAVAYLYMRLEGAYPNGGADRSLDALAALDLTTKEQWLCFLGFGLSFAVKLPMFPFHTWLPDAHTEAPTPGSVVLAGVLLKMGGYGFIRFAIPMFPDAVAAATPFLFFLGAFGIIFGALTALVQDDVKRLVAYSSVSHMGLILLGIFALNVEGVSGSVFQMLAHGLTTGGLFLLIGMLYERRHTRLFADFGGVAKAMPLFAVLFVVVTLGSIGMPGTNGFVGEFLIFKGVFDVSPLTAMFAVTGLVLGAWYMLLAIRRIFFGEITNPANAALKDVDRREILVMAPVVLLIVLLGVFPAPILRKMEPSVKAVVDKFVAAQGK